MRSLAELVDQRVFEARLVKRWRTRHTEDKRISYALLGSPRMNVRCASELFFEGCAYRDLMHPSAIVHGEVLAHCRSCVAGTGSRRTISDCPPLHGTFDDCTFISNDTFICTIMNAPRAYIDKAQSVMSTAVRLGERYSAKSSSLPKVRTEAIRTPQP
jgi:hypothetical protein